MRAIKLSDLPKRFRKTLEPPKPTKPKVSNKDRLVNKFDALWEGPKLIKEHKFCDFRKFRLDYAHLPSRVGIELHGGTWSGGRHVRGKGFQDDRGKMNLALSLGWCVFELTDQMIDAEWIEVIINTISSRMKKAA